ncbi:ATP-binding cassette domain-containing protein [Paenibacillus sp. MBLB4367]|uniref:ABC transporter ATP-binding protein n=1 Tax=Paenibacillus sp. MBLB4367 TaxID=3384767 RepID=UPI0039082241
MSKVLEVNQLVKRYGDHTALHGVSFSVNAGSCFGLLGPNGAGKSTTMKIITSIIESNEGTTSVFGKDIRKEADAIRRQVGYVPQDITLFEKLSARDNLTFFGEMYGVRGKELKTRIHDVLEQVGLTERAGDAIGTFSGGMKRRINIAAALLHKPKLVILDEPTVGIDPQSRNHIFEMIRELKASGVSMIYSTHYMEEVEALCDDIAIIDHGKVIVQGSLDQLLATYATKAIYMEAEGLTQAPALPGVGKTYAEGKGWVYECGDVLQTMAEASRTLAERGLTVKALEILRPSLESVFLKLTGTTLRD